MRRLLLILSLLLLAAAPAAAQPSEGPAEIRAVISRMQDAWNRGDFQGYMEGFWNPGVRFVSKGRMLTGWQETLDHYVRDYDTPEKRGTLRFWDVEVEMLGPDVAQMTGRYELKSRGLAQDGVNTRLFRKIGGKWVIILNHVSSRDVPPDVNAVAHPGSPPYPRSCPRRRRRIHGQSCRPCPSAGDSRRDPRPRSR